MLMLDGVRVRCAIAAGQKWAGGDKRRPSLRFKRRSRSPKVCNPNKDGKSVKKSGKKKKRFRAGASKMFFALFGWLCEMFNCLLAQMANLPVTWVHVEDDLLPQVNLKIEWTRIMIIFLEKTPNHTSKPIKKRTSASRCLPKFKFRCVCVVCINMYTRGSSA